MKGRMVIDVDIPDSIGILDGVMKFSDESKEGAYRWTYTKSGKECNVDLLLRCHTIVVCYDGELLYTSDNIHSGSDLAATIEFAIINLEKRYKEDGIIGGIAHDY